MGKDLSSLFDRITDILYRQDRTPNHESTRRPKREREMGEKECSHLREKMARGVNDMFDVLLDGLVENTLVAPVVKAQLLEVKRRCVTEMANLCDHFEGEEAAIRDKHRGPKLKSSLENLGRETIAKAGAIINGAREECNRLLLSAGLAELTFRDTEPN